MCHHVPLIGGGCDVANCWVWRSRNYVVNVSQQTAGCGVGVAKLWVCYIKLLGEA
jgi:hypothetical protein